MDKNRRTARAALASAAARASKNPHDPSAAAAVVELRREYQTLTLEQHIQAVVNDAPPLTAEQVDRLRSLLPAPSDVEVAAA